MQVGVIGASVERGWARTAHLPALGALPDLEVSAVASTNAARADEAARHWDVPHAFDDARKLIAHPDVDLVTIAVPLPRRDGLVEAAIAAGKHVYCEWPLASDADAAARLHDRATEAGVQHAVGLQSRHHPAIRYLRDLIADGWLGDVLSASMTFSVSTPFVWPRRYAVLFETGAVNHLLMVGGHAIDLFRYGVGDFAELSATLTTRIRHVMLAGTSDRVEVTTPDQIAVTGILRSGAMASVHLAVGGPRGAGYRLEILGTAGRLLLRSADDSLVGPQLSLFVGHGRDDYTLQPVPDRYLPSLADAPVAVRNVGQVYAGLAEAIRTGTPVEPDFATGTAMLRVLDAVAESAATGRRQQLP